MDSYTIKKIRLHRLKLPLKSPFTTHLQKVTEREGIIIEMIDHEGHIGLGECVAFSSPWYTEETVQTCWDALKNWLIPSVLNKDFQKPDQMMENLYHLKGNRMAKSGLDLAHWDLFAKRLQRPLWQVIGGVRREIEAGVVLTGNTTKEMMGKLQEAAEKGYRRVKIKIDANTKPASIQQLIDSHPTMQFFADANGIFSQVGLNALLPFDQIGLTLIEQPFQEDDWDKLQEASAQMTTPIALDESIRSIDDVKRMIALNAGQIIVLKAGRVGGITPSRAIHDLAKHHQIPIWIGGMIEFGVSKAHNLALASLSEVQLPGDFSASDHFWEEDIVAPMIEVSQGQVSLTDAPGIGYRLNRLAIEKYSLHSSSFS